MKIKKLTEKLLSKYPNFFCNKWDVYHQLFCVTGNGYSWKLGELTYKNENKEKYVTHTKNLKDKMKDFSSRKDRYPSIKRVTCELSKHSKIANIPNNIRPDWLIAVEEMLCYLVYVEHLLSPAENKIVSEAWEKVKVIKNERLAKTFSKALFCRKSLYMRTVSIDDLHLQPVKKPVIELPLKFYYVDKEEEIK